MQLVDLLDLICMHVLKNKFKFKDTVSKEYKSKIIYRIKCKKTYICKAYRHAITRISEHKKESTRNQKNGRKHPFFRDI